MRHLVVMDIEGGGECPLAVLGALDTAMGPHPQMLDAMTITPQMARSLAVLLRQARGEPEEG